MTVKIFKLFKIRFSSFLISNKVIYSCVKLKNYNYKVHLLNFYIFTHIVIYSIKVDKGKTVLNGVN